MGFRGPEVQILSSRPVIQGISSYRVNPFFYWFYAGSMKCWGKFVEGASRLKLARNIGAKALQEINSALHRYGFVDSIDQWICGHQQS